MSPAALAPSKSEAKMNQEAAEFAYRFIDSSYRSIDSQQSNAEGGLPGVTREYRLPIFTSSEHKKDYVNAGIEGYVWGAISIHMLLHYILGLQENEAGKISIAPMFSLAPRKPGATCRVGPAQWGKNEIVLTCTIQDQEHYTIHVHCTIPILDPELASLLDMPPQPEQPVEQE